MRTLESKRRYIAALVFAAILVASLLTLLWIEHRERKQAEDSAARRCVDELYYVEPPPPYASLQVWTLAVAAVISSVGTISTIILAWRSDRRSAREQALKIEQLEHELKELRRKSNSPAPKKEKKKAR